MASEIDDNSRRLRKNDTSTLTSIQNQGDAQVAKFSSLISSSEEELDLIEEAIGEVGARALAKALQQHKSTCLKRVHLDANSLNDGGAIALAEALQTSQYLEYISASENMIFSEGAKALAQALLSQHASLKEFLLSKNCFGVEGTKAVAKALRANRCSPLESLGLEENEIGDEGAKELATALQSTKLLQDLNLNDNGIGDDGATALAKALPRCASLNFLHLSRNEIRDKGAKALARALQRKDTSLEVLDLSENSIGSEGGIALARALRHKDSSSLQGLRISGNNIGDKGAKALAHALQMQTTTLERLDLSKNAISDVGVKALARALQQNRKTSLKKIVLSDNTSIGDSGAKALAEVLKMTNIPLKKLDLTCTGIGNEGAKALGQALLVNKSLEYLILRETQIRDKRAFALAVKYRKEDATLPNLEIRLDEDTRAIDLVKTSPSAKERPRDTTITTESGNRNEPLEPESQVERLVDDAMEAYSNKQYQSAAVKYLKALKQSPGKLDANWYRVLDTNSLAKLCQMCFEPSQTDLETLDRIVMDRSKLKLVRALAALALGLCQYYVHDRDEAGDSFRMAIAFGEEYAEKHRASADTAKQSAVKLMGDTIVRQARERLGELESYQMVDEYESIIRRRFVISETWLQPDGTPLPYHGRQTRFSIEDSNRVGMLKSNICRLLSIGGETCDHCHRHRGEFGAVHFDVCGRCQRAYYCSVECQQAQWQAGHSECCRAPGQILPGDFVVVRDAVQSIIMPELNGEVVQVHGPAPNQTGEWLVQKPGSTKVESIAADRLHRLRPAK